jgi:hypothetical protein
VAVVFAAVAASAGAFNSDKGYQVLVKTTGNNSELTDHLDITSAQGTAPKVVMSLDLPRLQAGDHVKISSELEVTTDCINAGGNCITYDDGLQGNPYTYSPLVDTQLILAPSATSTVGTPISDQSERECRQSPMAVRHHHCTLVFTDAAFNVPRSGDLACPLNGCYVNLVASAHNDAAVPGDRLIVGEDEPGGTTRKDKGRINMVRLRPDPTATAPVQSLKTTDALPAELPVAAGVIQHTVVFSQQLDNLTTDEQLEVSANMDTDISALPYRVLIQSRLILTTSPTATTESAAAIQGGEVTEANGFNCTHFDKATSLSPWDNPCQTQKVGVSRMLADAGTPLYLNLVVGTEAILGGCDCTVGPDDKVQVTGGVLKVVRYPASRRL